MYKEEMSKIVPKEREKKKEKVYGIVCNLIAARWADSEAGMVLIVIPWISTLFLRWLIALCKRYALQIYLSLSIYERSTVSSFKI